MPRPHPSECRDRWLEPFSSDSIWNTAVGSGARFEPAGLFAEGDARGVPDNFHNDQDFLVRTSTADPVTDWKNQGDQLLLPPFAKNKFRTLGLGGQRPPLL